MRASATPPATGSSGSTPTSGSTRRTARSCGPCFAGLKWENAAYLMQQLSTTDDPYGSRVAVDHVRLFRRDPALRWEYRVHEQILLSIRRAGHDLRRTDVVISHSGYQTPGSSERKLRAEPGAAAAAGCRAAGRPDHAVPPRPGVSAYGPHRRSLADLAPQPGAVAAGLLDPPAAVRGDRAGPRIAGPEGRGTGGLPRRTRPVPRCRGAPLPGGRAPARPGRRGRRRGMLAAVAADSGRNHLAAGDAGRRGYKARHLLAEVYRCQGRQAEAEAQWRLVVARSPGSRRPGKGSANSTWPRDGGLSWTRR